MGGRRGEVGGPAPAIFQDMEQLSDLIPLRAVLYGPNALLPALSRAELIGIIGKPIRRKSKYRNVRYEYIKRIDLDVLFLIG